MITNSMIEETLKGAGLWYATNNYFIARVTSIEKDGMPIGYMANTTVVVNHTENEIFVYPVIANSRIDIEKRITYCYEDIQKIYVVDRSLMQVSVTAKKGDRTTFAINVDIGYNNIQLNHLKAFVESFTNEGACELYKERNIFTSNSQNTTQITESNIKEAKSIVIAFIAFFFFTSISGSFLASGNMIGILGIMFAVAWLVIVISVFVKRNVRDTNRNGTNISHDQIHGISQEERQEMQEKIDEDIVVSSGPIDTGDEDFGGIKKF